MRVLDVPPSISSRSGGPARSTLANCEAVLRVDPNAQVTLATTAQGLDSEWRASLESQMPPAMKLLVFPAFGKNAFSFSPRLAAWLCKNVRRYDLVVVRALFHPMSTVTAGIARSRGVPYVVVPHGTLSPYTFAHRRTLLKRAYFRLLERRTLASAAAVRFTCEAERKQAPFWGARGLVRVIPHPYKPRFDWKDNGRPRRRRQILFLSRLHPVKGIDVLLGAIREMMRADPDIRLVLAGSGPGFFERRVRSLIDQLGLDDTVTMPGFVDGEQKAHLLRESAVFVLPSRQESFGVAVVEAIDAGLPVVISRNVGIWPEVEAAGAGIVVNPLTPGALASSLLRLLNDEALQDEMRRRGRKLVDVTFDPGRVGHQLSELYRSAAGLPPPTVSECSAQRGAQGSGA